MNLGLSLLFGSCSICVPTISMVGFVVRSASSFMIVKAKTFVDAGLGLCYNEKNQCRGILAI